MANARRGSDVAAATAHEHEGMRVKFLSPRCIEMLGMRGYKPVFYPDGNPVRVGHLLMCEIAEGNAARREAMMADADEETLAELASTGKRSWGSGDIIRLTWSCAVWRGVLALYRDLPPQGKVRRGIEFASQVRGKEPRYVHAGFYDPGDQ